MLRLLVHNVTLICLRDISIMLTKQGQRLLQEPSDWRDEVHSLSSNTLTPQLYTPISLCFLRFSSLSLNFMLYFGTGFIYFFYCVFFSFLFFVFQQKEKLCSTKHALYSTVTIEMVRRCNNMSLHYFTLMLTYCLIFECLGNGGSSWLNLCWS